MRFLLAALSTVASGSAEALYWIGDGFKGVSDWAEAKIHDVNVRKLRGRG